MSVHDHQDDLTRLVHDLRTPLAIVAGFAELLERRADTLTEERRADYIARIRESQPDDKRDQRKGAAEQEHAPEGAARFHGVRTNQDQL